MTETDEIDMKKYYKESMNSSQFFEKINKISNIQTKQRERRRKLIKSKMKRETLKQIIRKLKRIIKTYFKNLYFTKLELEQDELLDIYDN